MEVARHVQSTQVDNIIYLQYSKKSIATVFAVSYIDTIKKNERGLELVTNVPSCFHTEKSFTHRLTLMFQFKVVSE